MKQQLNCYAIFFIVIFPSLSLDCNKNSLRAKISGDYQDVLNLQRGPLISRFNNGCFLRDQCHYIIGGSGYTSCVQLGSITIDLRQTYELNTLVIWLWDRDSRTYNIVVYAVETIILDTLGSAGVLRIRFKDQLVTQFRIYNRNGSTSNAHFQIIKAEAFYEF